MLFGKPVLNTLFYTVTKKWHATVQNLYNVNFIRYCLLHIKRKMSNRWKF